MKITLEHDEIVTAIKNYVGGQGIDTGGKAVTVNLTAGRKENGHSAVVDIVPIPPTCTTGMGSAINKPVDQEDTAFGEEADTPEQDAGDDGDSMFPEDSEA